MEAANAAATRTSDFDDRLKLILDGLPLRRPREMQHIANTVLVLLG